jgi:hypothetical protein
MHDYGRNFVPLCQITKEKIQNEKGKTTTNSIFVAF